MTFTLAISLDKTKQVYKQIFYSMIFCNNADVDGSDMSDKV